MKLAGAAMKLAVRRRKLAVVWIAVPLLAAAAELPAQPRAPRDAETEAARRETLARAFGPLTQLVVHVQLVGSAEALGLSPDTVAAQVEGHLAAALPHIIVLPGGIEGEDVSMRDTGQATLSVWTVGDDNPIAYHLRIEAGSLHAITVYDSEVLGYSGRRRFPADLDVAVRGLVREFANEFMSVRGEL